MEISAIMNIHELALNRRIKQEFKGMDNKGPEAVSHSIRMTEQVDPRMHTVQQVDVGEVTQKDKYITGHMVKIDT